MLYILTAVVGLLLLLYKYLNNTYGYWKERNIPYHEPMTFFGSMWDSIIMKKSLGEIYIDLYNSFKDAPVVGLYKMREPGLLIRDPSIAKDILIKDFHHFEKNDAFVDETVDPIASKNPFFQFGQSWKTTRGQLSHCFTSGKMKYMVPLMNTVAQDMVNYIEKEGELGRHTIDTKELASKFTSDNVASCAFGVEGKAFEDPNSEFRNVGKQILQPSISLTIKLLLTFLFPTSGKLLRIRFIPEFAANYFRNVIKESLKYRQKHNIVRNDFLDAITQMKFKPGEASLSFDDITAHAVSFFGDGFETSSITVSFLLYDLAANIDAQEQLRSEINEIILKHGGSLTYDAIQEMTFLDRALSESLRLHPPAMFLSKVCTVPYNLVIPNSAEEIRIEEGTSVVINAYSMHHDPKYFPNPEKYDPGRFLESRKLDIIGGTYIPFGEGPRICIGMKFAILQVKIAVISIIRNFDVKVNKKTKEPLEIDPNYFLLLAKGGLWLDFHKRDE